MAGNVPGSPPSVPSHESWVGYMADHHAHRGNSSLPINSTVPINGTQPANMTDALNSTVATVMGVLVADGSGNQHEDTGLVIASYALLGIFLGFFVLVVGIDMRAKHRTGELRDDMRGVMNGFILLFKAIPKLFIALYSKLVSLIPKKSAAPNEADVEAAGQKTRESQAIVQRLGAKATSPDTTLSIASFGSGLEANS